GLGERALGSLISGGWLAAGAVIAVEERKGMRPVLPDRLKAFDVRAYGDTEITFARAAG
ncbi:MAG: 16S rRNA (guanine(966)-N(2))-methyltransferase RsmD, partial [Methylocystis sp.]